MAGFDDLIRNALAKQGTTTPQSRANVYESSRQALERMLEKNPGLDSAAQNTQRSRLEAAIRNIESDFSSDPASPVSQPLQQPPVQSKAPPPAQPQVQPVAPSISSPASAASASRAPMPSSAARPAPQPQAPLAPPTGVGNRVPPPAGGSKRVEPGFAMPNIPPPPDPDAPALGTRQEASVDAVRLEGENTSYDPALLQERKPYAKTLLWTIILVGLCVFLWWAWTFGPTLLRQQLDGSVPNPSPTILAEGFNPEGSDGWVSVFSADGNPEALEFADRGAVELIRAEGRTFARMASRAGSSSNTILISVPPGVMQTLRGKSATFEVILRATGEEGHQFAVFCEFGDMGSCGRKRFEARDQVEAFIFDVLVNDKDLAPGQSANLAIMTDVSLGGESVDLYSVRVRTGS